VPSLHFGFTQSPGHQQHLGTQDISELSNPLLDGAHPSGLSIMPFPLKPGLVDRFDVTLFYPAALYSPRQVVLKETL
jgi:hypothetical protein